ncbi:MAG TPA: sialidase family protein, partial [Candidatus Limnocylindrales bacterium]
LVVVAELLEDYGRRSARTFEAALRSADGGATWSDPAVIAEARGFDVVDPASRRPIRSGWALPDIAVDRSTGRLYATWTDGRFAGDRAGIALSSSDDGGATWSMPRAVDAVEPGRASFTPAIEVGPDGTVVATYYRATIDEAARDDFATSVVIARSSDSGATWQRQDLSPAPFDLHGAPDAGGLFLGDYTGLAIASSATGGTTDWRAIAAGSIVNAGDVANRTDVAVTVAGPQ